MEQRIFNADSAVLGRFASFVAKRLLMGENIIVVNAEKCVVSGNPIALKKFYSHRKERGDPYKGPFYPRYPDRILHRTIRGMLPKNLRGREALKRLRVFIGCPEQYVGKFEKIGLKTANDLRCKYLKLQEISKQLGGKI